MVVVWLAYCLRYSPPTNRLLHHASVGVLWIAGLFLILFFVSGTYADTIANRTLRTYNMYLNMRTAPRVSSGLSWMPFASSRQPPAEDEKPAWRGPYGSSFGAGSRAAPPRTFQRRGAPPVLPPTRNERGEIVFSSRVDTEFREGYERYRNAFERKRRDKLEAQRRRKAAWLPWPLSLWQRAPLPETPRDTPSGTPRSTSAPSPAVRRRTSAPPSRPAS